MTRILTTLLTLVLIPCLAWASPDSNLVKSLMARSVTVDTFIGADCQGSGTATHYQDGYYITAWHVVESVAKKGKVFINHTYPATIVAHGNNPDNVQDWALLKSELVLEPTRVCYTYEPGDLVYCVGNNSSDGLAVSVGFLGSRMQGGYWTSMVSSQGGASGGGLFNEKGELIQFVHGGPWLVEGLASDSTSTWSNPVRPEMFEKVESTAVAAPAVVRVPDTSLLDSITRSDKPDDISFTLFNGDKKKLSDYRGKPVVINCWAMWCKPCLEELPGLQSVYSKRKDEFTFLGLCDKSSKDPQFYVRKYKYTWTFAVADFAGTPFKPKAWPTTYFIDKEGKIVATVSGKISPAEFNENLDKIVE